MSSTPEAPALIQYACERCKTRFVLPPSSRQLSIAGKFRAFSMGVGRAFKFHEGLGAGYDTSRRQLLAKMDDEAYQSFVQSFRFCHECRQFVCNECWSTSRRSCLTCVAKSMTGTVRPRPPFAPTGPEIPRPVVSSLNPPRKGRLRRDAMLVALGLIIVLVSVEAGSLIVSNLPGTTAIATPTPQTSASFSPSTSPTDTLEATPTDTPTDSMSAGPSSSASASASVNLTPTQTPKPGTTPGPTVRPTAPPPVITPAPTPTPTPTPVPTAPLAANPTINCSDNNLGVAPADVSCSITSDQSSYVGATMNWVVYSGANGSTAISTGPTNAWPQLPADTYTIQLFIDRGGTEVNSAVVYLTLTLN
jgi:hypothetical protein